MKFFALDNDCSDFLYWLYNRCTELDKEPQEEQIRM